MSQEETESTAPEGEESEPRKFSNRRRRILRRLWRAEVFYAAGLTSFAVLAVLAHFYAYFQWDITVQQFIRHISVPGFGEFMSLVSVIGNGRTPYILSVLTALVFLLRRLRGEAVGILLATAGSGFINGGIKMLIARPRPTFEPDMTFTFFSGNSFPSGHVTFYVSYFGFLFFLAYALLPRGSMARRVALFITVLPILLIGFSRVYLFAHYPSDTLGSYLFGGLWLGLTLDLYRRWKQN